MPTIIETIKQRHSTRAFLNKPVAPDLVIQLIDAARFAPSGCNTQPWDVAIVQGKTLTRLGNAIIQAREADLPENPDYAYYPPQWREPYKTRRAHCGLALYGAVGIGSQDKQARKEQWYANYHCFGAPVCLLCFIDRDLGKGAWMDYGMFIQNVLLAAMDLGLATCPQASLAEYPDIVRQTLAWPKEQDLLCGIALGYPDKSHAINQYRTEREPTEQFTTWFT